MHVSVNLINVSCVSCFMNHMALLFLIFFMTFESRVQSLFKKERKQTNKMKWKKETRAKKKNQILFSICESFPVLFCFLTRTIHEHQVTIVHVVLQTTSFLTITVDCF